MKLKEAFGMTISKWRFIHDLLKEVFLEMGESCSFCRYTEEVFGSRKCRSCCVYELCQGNGSEYWKIVDFVADAMKFVDSLIVKLELLEKKMVRKDEVESD